MGLFDRLKRLVGGKPQGIDAEGALSLREGSAELEYFIATGELERGVDLAHGFEHLAELLSYDPTRPEWLALIDAYVDQAGVGGDALEAALIDPERRGYFAIEAMRARLLARRGDFDGAIALIAAVGLAKPDVPFIDWALDWLDRDGQVQALSTDTALQLLGAITQSFDEWVRLPPRRRTAAARFADVAVRIQERGQLPDPARMLVVGILRRAGRFADGLRLARAEYAAKPSWAAAVGEGLILRAEGKVDEAEAAFRRSVSHDPADISALLEAADMFADREMWDRALAVYDEVLGKKPDKGWAIASAAYCRWKVHGDEASWLRVQALAEEQPPNQRAAALVGRHLRYSGFLPESGDATANVIRQVLGQFDPDAGKGERSSVEVGVSTFEAPSNRVAFELGATALGQPIDVVIRYNTSNTAIDPRDPREALEPIAVTLWRKDGDGLVPAVAAPPAAVLTAIADLARAPYRPRELWAAAGVVAAELGPAAMESILAAAVRPPTPPEPLEVIGWVGRVQLAVAMVTAQLDRGWDDSARRRGLYSLLLGPRDWTTGAAIIAASWLANTERALSVDIGEAFRRLDDASPAAGHWDFREALYWHWRDLPHLYDDERKEIHDKLVELIQAEEES